MKNIDLLTGNIGFIGGGMMAEAIISKLLVDCIENNNLIVSDLSEQRRVYLSEKYNIESTSDNRTVATRSDIIILSVKPDVIPIILSEISDLVDTEKLIVSIAAGISTSFIESLLPEASQVIRVMPNTPALIGMGTSGVACGKCASDKSKQTALTIFSSIGLAFDVPESKIDAITGLSGSGPAYVYLVIEALADGGVKMGLPRSIAIQMAAQTVAGAASMVLETKEHPAILKDKVTTPGGTTIEGIATLEKGAVRDSFIEAVSAAAKRSFELGKK